MDVGSYKFMTEERRRSNRKRRTLYVLAMLILGTGFGTLLFWLINGQSFSSAKSGQRGPECPVIPDEQKFDCHPDRPVTEDECNRRGCCYKAASDLQVSDTDLISSSYLGVPSCYYPANFTGYEVSGSIEKNEKGIKANLTRTGPPSGFIKDVKNIHLEIIYVDSNILRIKLTDAASNRFEPDVKLYHHIQEDMEGVLYSADLNDEGLLTVTRNDSGAHVFKASLSQMVYSDQFLQLTTQATSTYLYGLGEHKEGILKSFNWNRYTLFNQGDLPVPNRNLYGTHPFYVLMEPDSSAHGVFLLNSNAMDVILQPTPAVTFRTVGGILDFFIMLGPSPSSVVAQYTEIIGRPFETPYWSLGFQLCRYGYFTLDKTNETLQRNLAAGVPIDVQWHDIDYMSTYLDFTYDKENFTDLPQFVEELHKNGMHYVAMISPGVSNTEPAGTYPPYDEAKKLDLFVKGPNGDDIEAKVWNYNLTVFPDFSNPATPSYWAKQFQDFHKELDFDGVWLDMNEPLNFMNGSKIGCPDSSFEVPQYVPGRPYPLNTLTLCMTAEHHKTKHYNEHNLVAYREAKATFEAIKDIRKRRPFIISRATFAGQGTHSGHWSGDITSNWEDMRYTIPSTLIFNMYGMPMIGSDICGFRLNTTMELCTRWQALGAFYPFSRNHNDYDTIEQDPAALGGTVLEATLNNLKTRYYLLPYLYQLFQKSHQHGHMVVKPLSFEFPFDPNTYAINEQFMWGYALLFSPALYENQKEVIAYFPEGVWYDFYTGKNMTSKGENKTLKAELTSMNIAVRGGNIVPCQLPGKTTTESRENPFDLLVALDSENRAYGEIFWDDGDSIDTYEKGKYNLIGFFVGDNKIITSVTKSYEAPMKLNEIKVYGVRQSPSNVTINDVSVPFTFEIYLSIDAKQFALLPDKLTIIWT